MLVLEARHAAVEIDTVAGIELGAHLDLLVDGHTRALHDLGKGEPAWLTDIAEHAVGIELHDLLDLMAKRLGGYRAPMGAVAPENGLLLHDRNPLAVLGCIDGGTLAGRSGTDHHHVVVMDCHGLLHLLSLVDVGCRLSPVAMTRRHVVSGT